MNSTYIMSVTNYQMPNKHVAPKTNTSMHNKTQYYMTYTKRIGFLFYLSNSQVLQENRKCMALVLFFHHLYYIFSFSLKIIPTNNNNNIRGRYREYVMNYICSYAEFTQPLLLKFPFYAT